MADLETLATTGLSFDEIGADPSTPASTNWRLYFKSGGAYIIDDTGAVIGPLAAGGGAVATDAIWDAAGDLAVGSGANTAAKLAIGANATVLTSNGTTATWAAPSGGGAPAGHLPVNVGSNTQTSTSDTLAVTITAAASGNVLIACIASIGTTGVSGIASTNTTWTLLEESTAGSTPYAALWKGVVAGGSSGTTVTITWSGNNSDRAAVVSEWDVITGTLDQSGERTAQGSTLGIAYSAPILPTNANALVVLSVATVNGTNPFRFATGLNAFEPIVLHTGSIGGYMGAFYGFPGTVPIVSAVFQTSGNHSSAIASLT